MVESSVDTQALLTPAKPLSRRGGTTLEQISRVAGVSVGTVSRGLRNDKSISVGTRERIQQLAADMKYRPNVSARALARGRLDNVGVIMGQGRNPLAIHEITSAMLAAVSNALAEAGYNMMFVLQPESASCDGKVDMPKMLAEKHVEGLLVVFELDSQLVDAAESMDISLVALDAVPRPGLLTINADDSMTTALAVEHLKNLGHRRIGYIGPDHKVHYCTRTRAMGYQLAMERLGLTPMPGAEQYRPLEESLDVLLGASYGATAMIAFHDDIAAKAMVMLGERGVRVPRDMSVVGIDNSRLCECVAPNLTSVPVPATQMGRLAVTRLIQKVCGEDTLERTLLVCPDAIVVRQSTAPPPK